MKRFFACLFTSRVSKSHCHLNNSHPQRNRETMETTLKNNPGSDPKIMEGNASSSSESKSINIILNHDFSGGLESWHPNCCHGYVVSAKSGSQGRMLMESNVNYAVVTGRNECWQGLEQDITDKISVGSTYKVSACVGVSGLPQVNSDVLATLKLQYRDSAANYLFIGRTSVIEGSWARLEGTFSLPTLPERVIFYLEGPSPGVDLLIQSVEITCSSPNEYNSAIAKCDSTGDGNIIVNPTFDDGLNNWSGRGCKIALHNSMADGKILPQIGKNFASATERTQSWNGIQQEITGKVQRKLAYEVTALVRIYGNNVTSADVRATLWVQTPDLREQYIGIANVQATDKNWVQMQGKFLLNGSPSKVVVYLEGPPPGTDILVNTLVLKHAAKAPPSTPPDFKNATFGVNVIENSNLNDGTKGWFPSAIVL
ncbi:hypothetical protein K1719_021693 [Acacia pycnantha]|nr:hypothetical protein K1719_021693 [Acacia pycnantha]